jgi:hypothetical protein
MFLDLNVYLSKTLPNKYYFLQLNEFIKKGSFNNLKEPFYKYVISCYFLAITVFTLLIMAALLSPYFSIN